MSEFGVKSEQRLLGWKAAALFRLGENAQADERYADASGYYEEVLRIASDHEPALFNRGVTELRRGHARVAAGVFSALLANRSPAPRDLPIIFKLAVAHACAGNLRDAYAIARRLVLDIGQPPADSGSPSRSQSSAARAS